MMMMMLILLLMMIVKMIMMLLMMIMPWCLWWLHGRWWWSSRFSIYNYRIINNLLLYSFLHSSSWSWTAFFPDSFTNQLYGKPWSDNCGNAATDFWNAHNLWYPTWSPNINNGEGAALKVNYVRVWKTQPDPWGLHLAWVMTLDLASQYRSNESIFIGIRSDYAMTWVGAMQNVWKLKQFESWSCIYMWRLKTIYVDTKVLSVCVCVCVSVCMCV
jgi:hypothetical protein